MMTHKTGDEEFECDICGKFFATEKILASHKKMHMPGLYLFSN